MGKVKKPVAPGMRSTDTTRSTAATDYSTNPVQKKSAVDKVGKGVNKLFSKAAKLFD